MITRPEPQLWIVSTAGDDESTYLRGKVTRGRERIDDGEPSRIAYFEWAAREDEDPLDEATWRRCMPALGRTVPLAAIQSEADSMPLDEFCRAYLNLWVKRGKVDALPGWDRLVDRTSSLTGPIVFALDAAPDLVSTSIAVAGLNESGNLHLEVVATGLGTHWVIDRLVELKAAHNPVSLHVGANAPAASLIPGMRSAGLLPADYQGEPFGALLKASQLLLDKVTNAEVVHLGQPPLMSAVDGAFRKSYGDGGFLWNRTSSSTDISPLIAATMALWGFVNRSEPQKTPVPLAVWA